MIQGSGFWTIDLKFEVVFIFHTPRDDAETYGATL